MSALVTVNEIKVFLPSEATDTQNDALITACESNVEATINSKCDKVTVNSVEEDILAQYTADTLPADLKTAIIKLAIAEFISSKTSVNYVAEGTAVIDRASRYRKDGLDLLAPHITPSVA